MRTESVIPTDDELLAFCGERYSKNMALAVAQYFERPSGFSNHLRRSLRQEFNNAVPRPLAARPPSRTEREEG